MALARAGAPQRAVRGCATLGDAEDGDDEGLIGVAERKIAAIAPPTILIRRFGKRIRKFRTFLEPFWNTCVFQRIPPII